MLLRASSEASGEPADVSRLTADATDEAGQPRATGVPNGEALLALAEATLLDDDWALEQARRRVVDELGPEALVDAAGVVGTFQQMDRVADATGIPLDGVLQVATGELRAELGVARFASAANTPEPGLVKAALIGLVGPLMPRLFRLMQAAARRMTTSASARV